MTTDSFVIYPLLCPVGYSIGKVVVHQGLECLCREDVQQILTCEDDQDTILLQVVCSVYHCLLLSLSLPHSSDNCIHYAYSHSLDTGELHTLTLVGIVKRSTTSILAQLGTVDAVKRPVWGPPCVCTHTPTPSLMPSVSVTEGVSDCCGRHWLEL